MKMLDFSLRRKGSYFKSYAGQTSGYANLGGLHAIFQQQRRHSCMCCWRTLYLAIQG